MGKKFAEYSKFDLSEINKEVLKKWDENQVFAKSMTEREGCPSFVFFEGPPSANGMPGIHHVMARSIKDIFCRYKTMKGFQVKRKAGWDTHGHNNMDTPDRPVLPNQRRTCPLFRPPAPDSAA